MANSHELSVHDHDRDSAGMTYVYPVVSRRAGGVSIGINLNPNQACNFRCVYCQVPNLVRGQAPEIDMARLRVELASMLAAVCEGDYLQTHAPEGARQLKDIALSGNGEPTSCRRFHEVVDLIGESMREHDLVGAISLVLITNGSLIRRPEVLRGLEAMAPLGGEVWFKIDGGTEERRRLVNDAAVKEAALLANLVAAADRCPTCVQSCFFAFDGAAPTEPECKAYLDLLARARERGVELRRVMLYGIARPSLQPEAPRLSKLDAAWLEALAQRVRALGIDASVHQ